MISQCWSVSTAATLTLSKDEEMEARKLDAQLRRIDSLKKRKASLPKGQFLTSFEESEIRRKPEIDYAPVMVKVKNGAARWTLDTEPLSKHEEKQVRSAEQRLGAIKSLHDRKARGVWLERWEMVELSCKPAIESSPLMMRVREGAPRCALEKERQSAPATVSATAPAPAQAPVPNTSPAPAPARAPVSCAPAPKASPAPLPVATPAPASPASPASPTHAEQDYAVSSAELSTNAQEQTLNHMVATIRGELGLEGSLTMAEVIVVANFQLDMPATGTLPQQARSLFRELTSA